MAFIGTSAHVTVTGVVPGSHRLPIEPLLVMLRHLERLDSTMGWRACALHKVTLAMPVATCVRHALDMRAVRMGVAARSALYHCMSPQERAREIGARYTGPTPGPPWAGVCAGAGFVARSNGNSVQIRNCPRNGRARQERSIEPLGDTGKAGHCGILIKVPCAKSGNQPAHALGRTAEGGRADASHRPSRAWRCTAVPLLGSP